MEETDHACQPWAWLPIDDRQAFGLCRLERLDHIVRFEAQMMQTFALTFEKTGHPGVRLERLEQFDLTGANG